MNILHKKPPIKNLCAALENYLPDHQVSLVQKAYEVSAKAHAGQYRKSGESYVSHPVNVALILANLHLDHYCIIAALLHDCIEDTELTRGEIAADFGEEVAHIVDGVSKLTGLEFHSKLEQQAHNFRKLFLAMSKDMRVMMIKLADRLHNMQTLGSMPREQQLKIAKETAEIHAPIARRLGLNGIRIALDDLCFKMIHPHRHRVLKKYIHRHAGNSKKIVAHIQSEIQNRLKQENLKATVFGREKQPCSIYRKMKIKHLKFNQVLDVYAFRIVVETVGDCYRALGIIHNLYKPLPGKFKDYIALPKANGYQSLHTILIGPNKIFAEVQIRSEEMHFISEYGIAAHWHYKSDRPKKNALASSSNWLGSLLEIQKNSDTSVEFLEETKTDLFPNEVFVFTPEGDIIHLPYQATVLDFAYAVHTNIGNHFFSASIDKKPVAADAKLKSGQTIAVVTKRHIKPEPSWLGIATTAKARSSIKAELKRKSKQELLQLGRHLFESAAAYFQIDLEDEKHDWRPMLEKLRCDNKESLFLKIALGEVLVSVAMNTLLGKNEHIRTQSIQIRQTQGMAISPAQCCYPLPGDRVVGVLSVSKGLVLHRFDCHNFRHVQQKTNQWLDVDWTAKAGEVFPVQIICDVENRRGTLAEVANVIARMDVNIEHLDIHEKGHALKSLNFTILVASPKRLDEIFAELRKLPVMREVSRKI